MEFKDVQHAKFVRSTVNISGIISFLRVDTLIFVSSIFNNFVNRDSYTVTALSQTSLIFDGIKNVSVINSQILPFDKGIQDFNVALIFRNVVNITFMNCEFKCQHFILFTYCQWIRWNNCTMQGQRYEITNIKYEIEIINSQFINYNKSVDVAVEVPSLLRVECNFKNCKICVINSTFTRSKNDYILKVIVKSQCKHLIMN